jgi:putative toxin-antitoxin system antitoxin component (TIGR02293 family)
MKEGRPVMTSAASRGTEAQRIADFLGIGDIAHDSVSLARKVVDGFPKTAAEAVYGKVGSRAFHAVIPESTYRRLRLSDGPLTRESSAKLYDFGRVHEAALRIFREDEALTMRFLTRPHMLLGKETPLAVAASSSAGADAVLDLLEQAEAGFPV